MKAVDFNAITEICSMLHQRFPDFAVLVTKSISTNIQPPPAPATLSTMTIEQREKEESNRLLKQKASLRFITDLYLVGICKDELSQNEGVVPTMLNTLFSKDKTQHANMSLACSFLKYYSSYFILTDKEIDNIPTREPILDTSELMPRSIQLLVTKIMANYYETVKKHLVFEHDRLKTMESSNDDMAISRGDLTDDRKEMFERRKKFYEKIRQAALILSEKMHLDMPELLEETNETLMTIGISTGKNVKEEKV